MMLYIFEVQIKRGIDPAEYIKAWKRGSQIIQRSPGALGIKLYKKRPSYPNIMLNIAMWESKTARDIAMESLKHADANTRALLHRHEDFGRVTVIGEFDDTDEVAAQLEQTQ